MAEFVVVGAGAAGLGSAIALALRGHGVTIVERDGAGLPASPEAAFEQWRRRGAPQVRHSHAFLARLRKLLCERAPHVLDALLDAGASEVRFADTAPPELGPLGSEPGDEDLVALACRRTTFDWVLRREALALPGVRLLTGAVRGLVGREGPVPHVEGVALEGGDVLRAAAVVDASGLRSRLPAWLEELGAGPAVEERSDTGIVYSSRFYRLRPGSGPPLRGGLSIADLDYLKYAVFAGDDHTFSITFAFWSHDREMRRLLSPGPFAAAARTLVFTAPWVEDDRSEPVTGVEAMGGLVNRRRWFVVDGRPLATGVFALGDSSVCTNPLYGRGCSLALVHAWSLADVVSEHGPASDAAALALEEATAAQLEPWYRAGLAQDRAPAEVEAGVADVGSLVRHGLLPAARTDPVVYRAFVRSFNLLDPPDELMADRRVVSRVLRTWQERGERPATEALGPERDEMVRLLAASAA